MDVYNDGTHIPVVAYANTAVLKSYSHEEHRLYTANVQFLLKEVWLNGLTHSVSISNYPISTSQNPRQFLDLHLVRQCLTN